MRENVQEVSRKAQDRNQARNIAEKATPQKVSSIEAATVLASLFGVVLPVGFPADPLPVPVPLPLLVELPPLPGVAVGWSPGAVTVASAVYSTELVNVTQFELFGMRGSYGTV